MIIVNDKDVCLKCGAYWCDNGHCCNGHPRIEVNTNGNTR